MNIVEITNAVEKSVKFMSFVQSFSDRDVYEYWGGGEIKYGSVVFNVESATLNDKLVEYNCIIYYGDRLTPNHGNRNSIFADATAILKRILSDLNDSNIEVADLSTITYFEQNFADLIAGGYMNVTLRTTGDNCGFGEGDFNNDFNKDFN